MPKPKHNGKAPVSTSHFMSAAATCLLSLFVSQHVQAQEGPIKPYKDALFSQADVLETADGGAYEVIDYQELRDINERDIEVERRVKDIYVSTGVSRNQQNETLALQGRPLDVTIVGPSEGASFTVIFVHGRSGDRRLGMNDYTFGGNFNRLKNLAMNNGGTYYSVSVPSFDEDGASRIGALVVDAFERSKGSPVILACASMGGIICQHVSRKETLVRHLKAMILLGGPPDTGFAATPFFRLKLPLYLAHGTADRVYRAEDQVAIYRQLRKSGYPVRLTLFRTGGHGTPVRMIDWRKALNVSLGAARK